MRVYTRDDLIEKFGDDKLSDMLEQKYKRCIWNTAEIVVPINDELVVWGRELLHDLLGESDREEFLWSVAGQMIHKLSMSADKEVSEYCKNFVEGVAQASNKPGSEKLWIDEASQLAFAGSARDFWRLLYEHRYDMGVLGGDSFDPAAAYVNACFDHINAMSQAMGKGAIIRVIGSVVVIGVGEKVESFVILNKKDIFNGSLVPMGSDEGLLKGMGRELKLELMSVSGSLIQSREEYSKIVDLWKKYKELDKDQ